MQTKTARDLRLFWISWLMLFFEILMIRWLSAEIRIFSYFHNIVLLFAFLGIGLGALTAKSSRQIPILVSLAISTTFILAIGASRYLGDFSLKNLSHLMSAGTNFLIWTGPQALSGFERFGALVAGTVLMALVVGLLTLFFVPFGQLLGRQFEAYDKPLRAYGIDLAGSLLGVLAFAGLSALSLPPVDWFLIGGLAALPLMKTRLEQTTGLLLTALSAVVLLLPQGDTRPWTLWSPYQKLEVMRTALKVVAPDGKVDEVPYGHHVNVNSTDYMQITNYTPELMKMFPALFPADTLPYDHYNIPYRFADNLDEVLVVGAGAGNDTAGALRNGAKHVTAVEIDPRIIQIGRDLHPERPFQDPRVTLINDDARSFFRHRGARYDLIVFGLLDSHTLSSSYSNVRLDNYVYTVESIREARRLLKPDGVMVLIFQVADAFIGARFYNIFEAALGHPPVAFDVRSGFRGWGGHGFVAGNKQVIARHIAADSMLRAIVTSTKKHDEAAWKNAAVGASTDDWPYLYLKGHSIPLQYLLIFGLLSLFSLAGLRVTRRMNQPPGDVSSIASETGIGPGKLRVDGHFFFLGAGFMLLEVQNISKLALLFGTTWTVNTVAISGVLLTILVGNIVAHFAKPKDLRPYYVGLAICLLLNYAVPPSMFAGLPFAAKVFASGLVSSLPIFFAGIIFSTSFAAAERRSEMFAANLLGAMVGGMIEALSFVFGIKSLLLFALLLYGLSLAATTKMLPSSNELRRAPHSS